ncbi:uncharacterized protein [Antedon mediterranea]|uniref:uncharacterized protein n=1 Tax=Antedon mediterranea TaxID=105859 RepID=UPI003AF81117
MASYESEEDHQLIQEEIDILNSIYIDELKITKNNSGITEFLEIVIHPATAGQAEQQYVCLTLILQIPDKYPHVEPKITIKNPRGISDEFVNGLKKSLEEYATENCGNQVLFSLIQHANDGLTHNNTPSCDCAVCLTGFQEEDSFTKTECYHYFHLSCLQRYIDVCTSDYEKEIAEIQQSMPQQTPKQLEIVCPVCREPISYQSEQNVHVGLMSDKDELFVPDDNMRKWQEKMKELYKKQADQGGIIDVEAESNKFLLDISTTVSAPLASLRLHDDKKTSAYRESDERNTKATKPRRANKHGNTYRERQLTNQREERRFRKEENDEDINRQRTKEFKSDIKKNEENVIGSDMLPTGQLSDENDQKRAGIPSESSINKKTEASDADKDDKNKSECDAKLEKEGNKQDNSLLSKNLQETRTKQFDKKYEKSYNHYRTDERKTSRWRNKDECSYLNGKQTRQAYSGGNSTRCVNPKLQSVWDSPSANKNTTGDKQNSSSVRKDLHSEAGSVSICHKSNETKNEHPCEVKDSTKETDESSTANTRSQQYHDRPSSRDQHHDRPTSRDQHHDRPTSRGQHHDRLSSRGQHHDRPSSRGQHHDRPSSRGQHHDRPSSRGQHDRPSSRGQHDRPSSRGQHHVRSSSRGQHHDRPSSRGQHHDRPGSRGQQYDRPSTRNQQHHIPGTKSQRPRSSGSTREKQHHSISSEIKSGHLLNKTSSTSDKVEKNNCNDDELKHNEQLKSDKQSNKDKQSDHQNYRSRNHFQRQQHSDGEPKKLIKSDKNDSSSTSFTQNKKKCDSKVSPVSCGLKDIAYSIIEKKSETDNTSSDIFLDKTSGPSPGFKSNVPVLPPPGF